MLKTPDQNERTFHVAQTYVSALSQWHKNDDEEKNCHEREKMV